MKTKTYQPYKIGCMGKAISGVYMIKIHFLSLKALKHEKRFGFVEIDHAVGCTDGKNIYFNMFSGGYSEETIEQDINYVFVHELIHTIDMNITEESVTYAGNMIQEKLYETK